MKTGPEYSALGLREGIHWHINPAVQIEYISENDKRETINYVRYTNKSTGEERIYSSPDIQVTDSMMTSSEMRTMDCIDCHNRPSHKYSSPTVYFDKAMIAGGISKDIPFIKKASMQILRGTFTDTDSAKIKIKDGLTDFYKTGYPDYYTSHTAIIDSAVTAVQKGYGQNTFPRMKVTYDAYPEHIGHLESNGCFRCHNGTFKSEKGNIISKDCNLCHTIVGQGNPSNMEYSTIKENLSFRHPVDIGTAWQESNCSECHLYLY
jgi:hypothetical protein